LQDAKTEALANLLRRKFGLPIKRILVVGCGSGIEASMLQKLLGAEVVGIDIDSGFEVAPVPGLDLRVGDARDLQFGAGSFDLVYSYHVLEHVPDYERALAEMRRVLAKGGRFCIGTPNRSRLVGYLGSKDATLMDKISWNRADWTARLRGRFRNEYGAHAGFTKGELQSALEAAFGSAQDVSLDYYREVYSRHRHLINGISACGLSRWIFPALYFIGPKEGIAL
jgi:SAM-dependent methyltransferase